MNPLRTRLFALAFAILAPCGLLMAQGEGKIAGAVSDPSGAAVPNAKVTVTETATGFARIAVTDSLGLYAVTSLRPAIYDLSVSVPGFRPFAGKGITLRADQDVTVNVKLEV